MISARESCRRRVVYWMKKLFALELGVEFNEIGIEQYSFWCKLYVYEYILLQLKLSHETSIW